MIRITTTLAALTISVLYAGPVLAAETASKDHPISDKARPAGATGWEGPAVVPGSVAADSISKDQYNSESKRIKADSRAARERCKGMAGSAKDACVTDAKAKQKSATAELQQRWKDSQKARADLRIANARDYDAAKQKCNERSGEDRTACLKETKAAHEQAKKKAQAEHTTTARRE